MWRNVFSYIGAFQFLGTFTDVELNLNFKLLVLHLKPFVVHSEPLV